MKLQNTLAIALGATVVLAAPHDKGAHARLHKKDLVTYTDVVTDIVTVTAQNAVVWINDNGAIVSTEFRDIVSTPATSTPSTPSTVEVTTTPTTTVVPTSTSTSSISSTTPNTQVAASPSAEASTASSSTSADDNAKIGPTSVTSAEPVLTTSTTSPPASTSTSGAAVHAVQGAANGFGVAYDMMGDSSCKDAETMTNDMQFLASQGFSIVRTYDIGCSNGDFVTAVGAAGMKAIVGILGVSNVASDLGTLITQVGSNWAHVDTVYIGNEVVAGGLNTAAVVANAVTTGRGILKTAGFTGNVVTVDTAGSMQNNPQLCSTSDYCAANCHAFFDTALTSGSQAGAYVYQQSQIIATNNPGKRVVITESGWPYESAIGSALATPENQRDAISSLLSSFGSSAGDLFLFQAYDASYKTPGTDGVEPYFGIFDSDHYNGSH